MSNKYLLGRTKRLWYLGLLLVASLFSQNAWAQVSAYTFSSSTATYSPITGGTVLSTANFDSDVYTNQPIGFSFVYNGTSYSAFGANANGWISMGATAPVNASNGVSGTTNNVISAFSRDLISGQHVVVSATTGTNTLSATNIGGLAVGNALSTAYAGMAIGTTITAISGVGPYTITMSANATSTTSGTVARFDSSTPGANPSEIRYETIGTAPNRTLIVQFKNVRRYYATPSVANSGDVLNFQIRLNETSNTIEIVYGNFVHTGTTSNTGQVGLRGASAADYNNRTSTTNWASTTAGGSNAATVTFSNTVFPSNGTRFTWTPPSCYAPSALVVTAVSTTSANFSWTSPGVAPGVGYEYFVSTTNTTPSTAANTGTATATTSGSATGLTASTTYYVFVRSECTADTDYSAWTASTSFFTGYCASTASGTTYYISNFVTTGGSTNISNNSGTTISPSGYGNFTAQSVTVQQTAAFGYTATWSTTGGVGFVILADFNNDLDFDDAGETLYNTTAYNFTTSYTGTFTVPLSVNTGSYRMRIRMNYDSNNPNECGAITNGETEDYTLIVTAAPSCTAPTVPVVSGVSNSAATLSWTAASSSPTNGYDLYVSTTNTAPTGSETYTDVAGVSQALSGLTGSTTYYWWVRSDCGSSTFSSWMTGGSFTTECNATVAFPAAEPFASYLPNTCWKEGLNGDLTAGPASTGASLNIWTGDDFANVGSSFLGSAKYNMYQASNNAWLISPQFTVPASPAHRMTYDVAATQFGATTALTTAWEADDYVEVLISASGMTSWTVIETYNSGNVPSNTGQGEVVDLSAYAGQTVRFAFRVVEGAANGFADFDFFIDNVVVEETPSCLIPTALSAVGASTNTIDFQWTASVSDPSNGYEWEARSSGAAGSGATGLAASGTVGYGITAASATGLFANTTYSIYVRSNCATSFSAWTSALNVFTGYCTPAPSSVDDEGITNVTFSGVNNTTSTEAGNYGDFTSLTGGSFAASTLATVNITYTTGYDYDTKIWVDWNNDLDFTDSGEEVYTGTSTSNSPTTLVATFTIPALTPVASYRMRIGGLDSGPATPCYTGSYGTFEDYTLVVTAAPSCLAPSAPVVASITSATATVSWTASTSAPTNGYDLYVSTTNTAPTGSETYTDVAGVSQALSALTASTTYYWWVRSECGSSSYSSWMTGGSFTTACDAIVAFPAAEPFASYLPNTCWNEGLNGDLTAGPATVGGSSTASWTEDGFLNSGFTGAAKVNIYTSSRNQWLITPQFAIPASPAYRVAYDVAATNWDETTLVTDWESDDFVEVLISTVGMTNWTVLDTYNASNVPSNSATNESIDLSSYAGQTIRLAFRAVEGTTDDFADLDFFIDNLVVEETPACLPPSAIVVSSVTSNTASLSWTGSTSDPANGYEWEVRSSGAAGSGATGLTASGSTAYGVVTASATGLTASTTYSVYVRSNCGSSFSAWTPASNFTTPCDAVTLPYTENFNPASTSRDCWIINDNNGDYENSWFAGDIYSWAYFYDGVDVTDNYPGIYTSSIDNDDYLISPPIPLTGNEWVTYDVYSSVDIDGTGYEVLLSTTGTSPGDFTTTLLAVTSPTNTSFEGMNIDLSAYSGTVYLAWHIPSGVNGDEYVFIDNVTVEVIPACIPPTSVSVTGLATNWTAAWSGASDVIIEYGPVGFTPGTSGTAGVNGTIVIGSGSSASFIVPADASYEAYVRANCTATADGYSTNVGPFSFNSYTIVPFSGTASITTCSATIYDHAATGDYSNNALGSLTIYPGSPSGILALNGTFSTEATYDYVTFYEGVGTGGTLLADYTGAGIISVVASAPNTPITVVFESDGSTVGSGFQMTASCQDVCTDIPVAAALTGNASVCPDESVNISLVTPEVGLTYIWQKRTTVGGTWTTIAGQTGPTLTATQTINTQYRARLGCVYYDGGVIATVPTQTWSVSMNSFENCYCTAIGNTQYGDNISNVTTGSINQSSTDLGGPAYTEYTPGAGTTTSYLRGGQYSISITTGDEDGDYVAAWIDYNHSGTFELSERLTLSGSLLTASTHTASFTVPNTALLGTTTLRVRIGWGFDGLSMDACSDLSDNGGETEDYIVTIAAGASNDAAANATIVSPPVYPACLNLSGDLALATDDPADASTGADLWYRFQASSNACRIAVSGGTATNVEIELQNSSASNATTIATENAQSANGSEILITDDLTPGVNYWVAIRNAGGVAGTFSVCIQTLAASTCDNGPAFASLCSSFKADWTGTGSYTATFTSVDVPANVYTYTSSNTSWIPLSIVPGTVGNVNPGGLQYGEAYNVSIAANYNLPNAVGVMQNAVAASSTSCPINIAPVAPLNMALAYNSTTSNDLVIPGTNPRVQGSWIQTDFTVCGAIGYSWTIRRVNYLNGSVQAFPDTTITTSRQMRLWPTNIPQLAAGRRFLIQVAPVFPWGTGSYDTANSRYVQISGSGGMIEEINNEEVVLVDKSLTTGVFASLYPNPNNGENVNINIAGIESESVNIRIMDASGRTVWSNNFFVEGILATTVSFDRPLSAGIYMVEMNYNGEISTQRMVVQK